MALNITFTGNIVDNNNNPLDCKCEIYHLESDTWSAPYDTSFQQYNMNAGDAQFLTQDGSVNVGDRFILKFYTQDLSLYGAFTIVHDGSNVYINDVKLMPDQPPMYGDPSDYWHLSSTSYGNTKEGNLYLGAKGDVITAVYSFTNDYQYIYNGLTLVHKDRWYGTDLFPNNDIQSVTFDWGDGSTDTDNTHTYTDISASYTVTVTITNKSGLTTTDIKQIKILNRKPSIAISTSPSVLYAGDTVNITGSVTDVDNTITQVVIKYKGNVIETINNPIGNILSSFILDPLYEPNPNLSFDVTWNNGFSSETFTINKTISLTNRPPVGTLTVTPTGGGNYELSVDASDPDGTVVAVDYKISVYNSLLGGETQVYEANGVDPNVTHTVSLGTEGEYTVRAIIYDNYGLSTELTYGLATEEQKIYFDWE
jgi:hypothetical protein